MVVCKDCSFLFATCCNRCFLYIWVCFLWHLLRFIRSLRDGSPAAASPALPSSGSPPVTSSPSPSSSSRPARPTSSEPLVAESLGVRAEGDRVAYLRSLVGNRSFEREVVEDAQSPSTQNVKVVNFTLESILSFKNDHAEHTMHARKPQPKAKIGLRPNYDNRKRAFMATQPTDRKRYLSESG